MADIVIRPSMKFIRAGYVITLLVVAAGVILSNHYLPPPSYPNWLPASETLKNRANSIKRNPSRAATTTFQV